ncbi:hypothetical protein MPSEU_000008700 [Mayamaea pseudoterrestris]|nr:hypothetical protein MPSEU_000008700 [Mayamaea pseudoterrestris]
MMQLRNSSYFSLMTAWFCYNFIDPVQSFNIATSLFRRHFSSRNSLSSPSCCQSTASSLSVTTTTNEATLRNVIFHNISKSQNPDLFCDLLMELGACSTSITDANVGTPDEVPLIGEPSDTFNPWRRSDEAWTPVPLWEQCTVTAQFASGISLEQVLKQVKETTLFMEASDEPQQLNKQSTQSSAANWLESPVVSVLPNQDWVVTVQQSWKPIIVANRIVLRFPWHTRDDVSKQLLQSGATAASTDSANSLIELELQGGIAFGTGEHATTQLCLEWLDGAVSDILQKQPATEPLTVMDYGAGSGALGMAACAMAPRRVHAVGIEIDYDSCRIANANAAINKVDMQTYLPPLTETTDGESKSLLLKAHAHARRRLEEQQQQHDNDDASGASVFLPDTMQSQQYDITVANILAGPLMALAPTLAGLTKPGGRLGLSGILPHQGKDVAKAYRAAGFIDMSVKKEMNGWVLVTGVRAL